jgi:SSS family solute:Na+ symporter
LQQVKATRPLAQSIGPYYSGISAYVCAGLAMVLGSWLKRLLRPSAETSP